MANFRTHVTTSIGVGCAYGVAGHVGYDVTLPTATLAAGLFTIGGILPDIDSDNGVVLRESLGLVAAVTPILALDRVLQRGLPQESMVLILAGIYLAIRFGLGWVLRHWTVHRGMWHSIPAALVAGFCIYYLCACPDMKPRLFKCCAITLGYVWHLILDEIYAVDTMRLRVKRSFGTALKMWGTNPWSNLFTYSLLAAAAWGMTQDRPTRGFLLPQLDGHHHASRDLPPTPQEYLPPHPR